jgi:hypothetical protein
MKTVTVQLAGDKDDVNRVVAQLVRATDAVRIESISDYEAEEREAVLTWTIEA